MTTKNSLISVILIAVILLAAWTTLSYHPHRANSTDTSSIPDSYMEDVVAIIMDKQGKMSMKIEAPKMVHFTENDTSQLTNPQLTIYRKSPQPWFITSKFAKSIAGIEKVDFWENVIIHHAADVSSPATVIKTPTLTIHPDQQRAETNDMITLIQPNIIVNATGMTANIDSGDIKLLSQARGEYAPGS